MEQDHRLYQLALLLSPHFSGEAVRGVVEDFAEYLSQREPSEAAETPRQFYRANLAEGGLRAPRPTVALALLAAAALAACGFWRMGYAPFSHQILRLSALALGLPLALWAAVSGSAAAPYAPARRFAVGRAALSALGIAVFTLLVFFFTRAWILRAMSGGSPWLVGTKLLDLLLLCRWAAGGLFLVSFYLMYRKSIWYFCLSVQAVAAWTLFRSIHLVLTGMLTETHDFAAQLRLCLAPFALGLGLSLLFALYLRRLTGKGSA